MNLQEVIEKVAKRNGVTVEEVRKEMGLALDVACGKPEKTLIEEMRQKEISSDGDVPTPEQFIQYCVEKLK